VFTLDEIEPMIPLHPLCFIDYQVPVYTSKGWKKIGDIKVNDLVLTHKGRYRRVTSLINYHGSSEVVTIKLKNNKQLTMTINHPILLENGIWKNAGECKIGDKVKILGNHCKRCKKPIPYHKKYCSHSCLSKDVTDRQWSDSKHRENISKKTSAQLKREYANGIRDGKLITKKAHLKMKELVDKGIHPFQRADVIIKNKLFTNLPKHRIASSKRMKKNNPMSDPLIVAKAQESVMKFYRDNPERRLNARMAKHRKSWKMTSIEKKMSILLDKIGVQYMFQYPILKYDVDFAIPGLMIAIECDGEYWHTDKKKDMIRDKNIEKEGWTILHYTDIKINKCLNEIEYELKRVLCNHIHRYTFAPLEIISVKKWKLRKNRKHYNFSVEEDESYLAKGIVVHNCRCIALPVIED